MKRNKIQSERGAIIIEGVFGVVVSIIIMAFLLSFGFYLYQQTMVRIVANEIAEEVVVTYKFKDVNKSSDIKLDNLKNLGRYRYWLWASKYDTANEKKGSTLANLRLSQTTLADAQSTPTVKINKIGDDVGRLHYEVTLTQSYEFMMGDLLSWIGLKDTEKISATVYVEAVDVSHYVNTIKLANYGLGKLSGADPLVSMVNSVVKLMKSVYKVFT